MRVECPTEGTDSQSRGIGIGFEVRPDPWRIDGLDQGGDAIVLVARNGADRMGVKNASVELDRVIRIGHVEPRMAPRRPRASKA